MEGVKMHGLFNFKFAFIALLLLISPLAASMGTDDDGPSRILATDYHVGIINVNITHLNGTPAVGYHAVFDSNAMYADLGDLSDSAGEARITIYWEYLSSGTLFIQDPHGKNIHKESITVFPDQVIYRDISVGDVLPLDRTLTGRVFNESSGISLAGVTVSLSGYDSFENDISLSNVTDSSGSYSISFPFSNIVPLYMAVVEPGYHQHNHYFQTVSGKTSYREDVPLLPVFKSDDLSRIRYVNESTGVPFSNGFAYMTAFPASEDHRMYYLPSQALGPGGWAQIDSGIGEVNADFRLRVPEYPVSSISISNTHLINGSAKDIEYGVTIPDNVTIKITLRNSSGNMNTGNLYTYERIYTPGGTFVFSYSASVQPDGTIEMSVPANRTLEFNVNAFNHMSKVVEIGTHPTDPISKIVMMDEQSPTEDPPMGEVEIHVIDDVGSFLSSLISMIPLLLAPTMISPVLPEP